MVNIHELYTFVNKKLMINVNIYLFIVIIDAVCFIL